jgi:transposase
MGEGLLHRRASHVVDELARQSMSPSRASTPAAYSLRIAIWIASLVASAIISWWLMASRDDVPRRHQHPCTPEGRRGLAKGGSQAEQDAREALGRSRGGYGSKACVIADGLGRAVAFVLAPGQAHELPHAIPLLDRLPGVPKGVVGDRGYASHAFRQPIWERGARPAIPSKRNEAPVTCPDWIYTNRNQVERSGPGSRSGEPLPPATRRLPPASWASSPSLPHAIGSSHNRP